MHSRNVYKVNYGVPFFESPTFYIGALLIMYSFLSGYGIFIFLFGGLLIITLDFVLRSFIIRRPYLYLVQILVLVILSISLFFTFRRNNFTVTILSPSEYCGEIGVVFGVEGYPKINEYDTLQFPLDSGLIITSTTLRSDTRVVINILSNGEYRKGDLVASNRNECKRISYEIYVLRKPNEIYIFDGNPSTHERNFLDSILKDCRKQY